ncbi:hypothetical protein PCE1_003685 [Barthelona sp. PCE]
MKILSIFVLSVLLALVSVRADPGLLINIAAMSKCPDYRDLVFNTLNPALEMLQITKTNYPEIKTDFIIAQCDPSQDFPWGWSSMHGQSELEGDLWHKIVASVEQTPLASYRFAQCYLAHQEDVPSASVDCIKKMFPDDYAKLNQKFNSGPISDHLLRFTYAAVQRLGAKWSPTVYFNGNSVCEYNSKNCMLGDNPADWAKAMCSLWRGEQPAGCANLQ